MVVEISRPGVPASWPPKALSSGTSSDSVDRRRRAGSVPAQGGPPLPQVGHLVAVVGKAQERQLGQLLVGQRQAEPVPEPGQGGVGHVLLLVGDVLPLAGLSHPVALDGLGQDDGRLAGRPHGGRVGGVDLDRIVAAAVERPDLLVGHARDHFPQFRVLAEELLPDVRAVFGLEVLVLAVDAFLHALEQQAGGIAGDERVPVAAPDHLDHVPARAAEDAFQLLDDLAVAADRAVQPLQVAVDDEDEIVELLPASHRDGAQRLRLVGFPVADERPDLPVRGVRQPAAGQVLQEAGLVNRHDRAQAHRHRRHLPVLRHQPRVRIGGKAAAVDFHAEFMQLVLGEPALHERAGVDARRRMALDEQQVTAVLAGRGPEEMLEAHVVEGRRGLETGDMAAELGGFRVRPQHDGQGVPPDQRPDAVVDRQLPRAQPVFLLGRDRVEVRRRGAVRDGRPLAAGLRDHLVQQEESTVRTLVGQNRIEGLPPLTGLSRVKIFQHQRPLGRNPGG